MRKWPLAGVVGLCGSRWKTVIRVPSRSPWDSTFHLVLCAPRPRHKNVNATNSPQAGLGPRRPTGRQCCSSLADGNKTKSVLLHKFFYQTEISFFFLVLFFLPECVFFKRTGCAPCCPTLLWVRHWNPRRGTRSQLPLPCWWPLGPISWSLLPLTVDPAVEFVALSTDDFGLVPKALNLSILSDKRTFSSFFWHHKTSSARLLWELMGRSVSVCGCSC